MKRTKVLWLRVHSDALQLPHLGELSKVLPPHGRTLEDLEMYLADGVVEVRAKSPKTKSHKMYLIPLGNIVAMEVVDTE